MADDFEKKIINHFIKDRKLHEWRGFVTKPDGKYYIIAVSGEPFETGCLYCHSEPSIAPPEIVKEYGKVAGFNRKVGDLIDAKFVYIPVDVPLSEARKGTTIFVGLYTVFFGIMLSVINVRFTGLYNRIESDKKKIVTMNSDLTELNQELENLVAERTMSLMALTVADKVRNPASVIGWTSKRILEKEEVSEKLRENLRDIIDESKKLESIVKDFEALLKSRRSLFKYQDINEIVKGVIAIVTKELGEKNITLSVNLSETPLKINTQKNLLKAAIFNIIRNSIEATQKGGSIKITTSGDKEKVMLTISDTGSGIAEEDVERIFDPFYSTKAVGFGMGLPLVKQIVAEHLGDIKVESRIGTGTTFNIIFPVRWIEKK